MPPIQPRIRSWDYNLKLAVPLIPGTAFFFCETVMRCSLNC